MDLLPPVPIMKKLLPNCLVCLLLIVFNQVSHAQRPQIPWMQLSATSLTDHQGNLTHLKPAKFSVFILLSPECPLSRNYVSVINKLAQQYQAACYGIVPGATYSTTDITKFVKDYKPLFPILVDKRKKLTKVLKGSTTPECILVNQEGRVLYRGLIDNWAYSLGKQRKVITEKYLEDALSHAQSGTAILISQTKPVGCLINDL